MSRWLAPWMLGTALCLFLGNTAGAADTQPETQTPMARVADSLPEIPPPSAALPVATWSLRLPAEGKVDYRGVLKTNSGAGAPAGGMLYPGPGIGGFLISVAAHALVVGATRNVLTQQQLAASDEVLSPYRPLLDAFTARELFSLAFQNTASVGRTELVEPTQSASSSRLVQGTPVFFLAQDEQTIQMDASMLVFPTGSPATAVPPPLVIRVISHARPAMPSENQPPDVGRHAAQSAWIKAESTALLAHAIDLALEAASAPLPADAPFQTFRYLEGQTARMERGQLVAQRCGRMVIRTLRGLLMSIPIASSGPPETNGACIPVTASR
ncbi:MAG: hypothetical protein JWR60_4270 [Polaromonas sp.]|nr:hypothetical protein [Polaromonas sp.]